MGNAELYGISLPENHWELCHVYTKYLTGQHNNIYASPMRIGVILRDLAAVLNNIDGNEILIVGDFNAKTPYGEIKERTEEVN